MEIPNLYDTHIIYRFVLILTNKNIVLQNMTK